MKLYAVRWDRPENMDGASKGNLLRLLRMAEWAENAGLCLSQHLWRCQERVRAERFCADLLFLFPTCNARVVVFKEAQDERV